MAIAGIALLAGISSATAATLPTGFEERTVVSGLTAPTAVAWAPDGRMFVAEKGGKVRVVTGGRHAGLDAAARHLRPRQHDGDRGLLGIAVDSSFASNHFLYLLYVYEPPFPPTELGPRTSRLTRVTVGDDNSVSPETVILGSIGDPPCPAPDILRSAALRSRP